ncbi:helix-turn-helix domain-containing protein [Candidatus Woesearchaeota archaeon]|nr:helix-turn-helix domain-containing protein [Candidatus Woesearchaeota archaeon]
MATLTAQQKLHLKKLIRELHSYKAPHTEFVTVYIPQGYELTKIIQHLAEEQGTASNIKSASTRKNVQSALERMIQHLRTFKKTPENGLAVFSGNVAAGEGKQDLRVWSMEPPIPLNTRIYRCDKNFVTNILEEMMVEHNVYGLVVLDRRDATIALLRGKTIIPLQKTHSEVPGKTKAGGQCLVKDTLIQSHDGNISLLHSSHNPQVVKSMVLETFSLGDSPITERWDVPKSEIYKIITKSPRLEVEASKDHIFYVRTNERIKEKAAEELKEGDFLIMPENIKIKGEIQTINAIQYYNSFRISAGGQDYLKKKREEKNLLQKELAKVAGLTQTGVSVFELGKRNARRATLQILCAALGIDFYWFLNCYASPELYREVKLPVLLDPNFAQFLGYLAGDGTFEKDRITFFEQSKGVALGYKRKFEQYFNLECSYRFREQKNYHQLRFTSRPLVRLINGEFPEIKKTRDTLIPEKILKSPPAIVAAFLKGLFDADGYASIRRDVGLGINNKTLAQQVQLALLRFGIIASLHEYDNRANKYSCNSRFTIDITEKQSLKLFKENIGFSCSRKSENLNLTIKLKTNKSNVRQIIVPGTEIRKIIEKAGYNKAMFPRVSNFFFNRRMISKEAFKNSILEYIKDEELKSKLNEIYEYPFLPVKIHRINKTQKEVEMIDISVSHHNFIANGLIVHNSSQRYARIREGAYKDHFKKISEYMKEQFLSLGNNLKGIIIGGPGITVSDFLNKDYLTGDIKKKIIGTRDLSYTEEFGLQELLDKSQDLLAEEEIAIEKKIMDWFFGVLRDYPRKVTYGEKETMKALEMNAVDTLFLSEQISEDKIFELEEKAQQGGATVRIISTETREGVQLRDLGGIAAVLRFEIE